MKKIISISLILFLMHHFLNIVLKEYRLIKISILISLIIVLSYNITKYLINNLKIREAVSITLLVFGLFESIKIIAFCFGLLPRYFDVPVFITLIMSISAIIIYIFILYNVAFFVKKREYLVKKDKNHG